METLEKIRESGVAPAEVWYLSTIVLTGILVIFIGILTFFVKGFFNRLQATLDGFEQSIEKLTKLTERHEWEIDALKKQQNKPRR